MPARPLWNVCFAEALGTFLLVLFGCGAVHVAVLTGDLTGLWQVAIVWGLVIMLAIYLVGPISGAHLNPAVTLSLAIHGLFAWRRVAAYIASQLVGSILAAGLLYSLFQPQLADKEAARGVTRGSPESIITAMCYGEYYPSPGALAGGNGPLTSAELRQWQQRGSTPIACVVEALGTAILLLVILAVASAENPAGPGRLAPVFIGLTVTMLICVFAPLTQAGFNPARDFGPRLFASLAGWGTVALPGPTPHGFWLVYLVSPIAGATAGVGLWRIALNPNLPAGTGDMTDG